MFATSCNHKADYQINIILSIEPLLFCKSDFAVRESASSIKTEQDLLKRSALFVASS